MDKIIEINAMIKANVLLLLYRSLILIENNYKIYNDFPYDSEIITIKYFRSFLDRIDQDISEEDYELYEKM